jgi:hypothetical protein
MGYNGLNDKYLEGALHHVNMAGPQCQEFNTDFILKIAMYEKYVRFGLQQLA